MTLQFMKNIADYVFLPPQMGMGKSLSVLALILRTLETAHSWSSQPEKTSSESWRPRPRSSATLVVASSDRTLLFHYIIEASTNWL